MHRLMGVNSTAAAAAGQPNVSCTCNCKRSLFQSMEITELEFVQIIIIVVVMMVMVVVITCLLSHYKLSARSFISRHSQGRRREDALSSEGCLWPSESTVSGNGIPERAKSHAAELQAQDRFWTTDLRRPPSLTPALLPPAAGLRPASAHRPPGRAALRPAGPLPPLPAHLPVPAARDRPAPHHLAVGRGGAPTLPGPLHPPASGPRAAAGTEPGVGARTPKQNHLRQ
ncbi:protein TMEPAI isoform X4 [Macaca fascicularis]|uniref:protein TMEPAI isoform X4 n=1 Tax=Macaca fascicularis TaxID=9541 RepID=UPI003D158A06